jgi:hypothetical protein
MERRLTSNDVHWHSSKLSRDSAKEKALAVCEMPMENDRNEETIVVTYDWRFRVPIMSLLGC